MPNSVTSPPSQSPAARAALEEEELERSIEVSLTNPGHFELIIDKEGRFFHGRKTFCNLLDKSEAENIPEPATTSSEYSTTTALITTPSTTKRENVSTDTTTYEPKSMFEQEISRFSASALSPSPSMTASEASSSTSSPSWSPATSDSDSDSDSSSTTAACTSPPRRKFAAAQQLVQGEPSEYEKLRAANIKDKEELLQTLQRDWQGFKDSEGLVTCESQKGAKKLKAVEREDAIANSRKGPGTSRASNAVCGKVKKTRPAGDVANKSEKGPRAVLINCQEEEEDRGAMEPKAPSKTLSESSTTTSPAATATNSTGGPYAAPFAEGEDILVHLEDGLIYLGVVVEVKEEQGQCLVHFGDGTERWSSFNQLQRLGAISDDECIPTSTPEHPEPVGSERESSEIKIHSLCSQASGNSEQCVEVSKEAQLGEKKFSCSHCDYLCATAANLRRHVRSHTGEKPYSCTKCDYTCSQSYILTIHTKKVHTDEKPYRCKQCDYSCSQAYDLKKHRRIHTGNKPYICTRCDYSSDYSSKLKQHKKRVHTGENYSCAKCDYSCSDSNYLKVHMRVHTGERPYSCTMCDYTCSTSKYLKIHMRVHTGEKPYSCTKCDYSCSQSSSLSRHMRVHTGDKPFSCAECPFRCSHLHILKKHILAGHNGEKSYSCNKCNYSSSRADHFAAHMKLHTGNKKHACSHCDYSTSYKSNFKRHMGKFH